MQLKPAVYYSQIPHTVDQCSQNQIAVAALYFHCSFTAKVSSAFLRPMCNRHLELDLLQTSIASTGLPLCIGTANLGYLGAKMWSNKKLFFSKILKRFIPLNKYKTVFVSSLFELKTALGVQDCESHWSH